jgi:hypothetical protein
VFLSLIDRLTDLHLSILQLFREPNDWKASDSRRLSGRNKTDASEVLLEAHPELVGHESLCEVLWAELHTAGLVDIATLHNRHEGEAVMKKRTTKFGDEFPGILGPESGRAAVQPVCRRSEFAAAAGLTKVI